MYVTDDTPNAEPRYRARFYFDPNSIPMATGNSPLHLLWLLRHFDRCAADRIPLSVNPVTSFALAAVDNAGGWKTSAWFNISDAPHPVEIDWQAATAAGATNGVPDAVDRWNAARPT